MKFLHILFSILCVLAIIFFFIFRRTKSITIFLLGGIFLLMYSVVAVAIIILLDNSLQRPDVRVQTDTSSDNSINSDIVEELFLTNLECIGSFLMLSFCLIYYGYLNMEVFNIRWTWKTLFEQGKLLPVLAWGLNLIFYIIYFTVSIYVQGFYNQNEINYLIKQLKITSFVRRISSRLQIIGFLLIGIYSYITGSINTSDEVADALFAKTGDRDSQKNFVSIKNKFYKNIDWNKDIFMTNSNTIDKDALKNALEKMNDVVTPEAKNYKPSFVLDSEYNKIGDELKIMVNEVINNTGVIKKTVADTAAGAATTPPLDKPVVTN
jgi:hypothetical protein